MCSMETPSNKYSTLNESREQVIHIKLPQWVNSVKGFQYLSKHVLTAIDYDNKSSLWASVC